MTDFKTLLANGKQKSAEQTEVKKSDPFLNLKKTIEKTEDKSQPTPQKQSEEEMLQQPSTISADEFNSPDQSDNVDTKVVEELKQNLNVLKISFDHTELVADAIRSVLIHVKRHPFLKDILLPEDCQLMVRALRESYGVTIVKKETRSEKRRVREQDVDKVLDELDDLQLDI